MGIKPDQLKEAMLQSLKDYNYNIRWDMTEASRKWTREGAKWLRKNPATHDTGKYNKGWKVSKTRYGHVLHNKDRGYLTHLLENDHKKVNDKGWVYGTPHIKPVEDQLIANFESECRDIIRKHSGNS